MALKICVLASGSSGNCICVASDRTAVLIDAGLSYRGTCRRLEPMGVDVAAITAVCLTHEHDDHKACLGVLHRRLGPALYANAGTIEALERNESLRGLPWNVFTPGSPFELGDLVVEPFSVPHDSYDPVGFVVNCGGARVGIVTDMGTATGLIRERLKRCQTVVVESNHDEALLKEAERPWSLKQRIAGRQGHLSNQEAGKLVAEIARPHLKVVFLAHLSDECNRPELALAAVRHALEDAGCHGVDVKLTYPDRPSDVVVNGACRAGLGTEE